MSVRLDVRSAAREANEVFRRWPVLICLPLVLCGVGTWASGELAKTKSVWLGLVSSLLVFVLGILAMPLYVAVSAMLLRYREGGVPDLSQVAGVFRLPALKTTLLSLFGRYLGWTLGFMVLFWLPLHLLQTLAFKDNPKSEVGAYLLVGAGGVLFFSWIGSMYFFALPLVAIRLDSPNNMVDVSVHQTKGKRRILMLLLLANFTPGGLYLLLDHFYLQPHTEVHGLIATLSFAEQVFGGCIATWFILVTTELAMQAEAGERSVLEPGEVETATLMRSGIEGLPG